MSKIETLSPINASYTGITKLNSHLDKITTALENTLSRDGSTPNQMEADFDLNSNRIINVLEPVNGGDVATKTYVDTLVSAVTGLATPIAHTWAKLVDGVLTLDTYAQLTALSAPAANVTYRVRGRAAKGDGGAGDFYYVPGSPATANAGTVITHSSGRFFRLGELPFVFRAEWFGDLSTGATFTATLQATVTAAGTYSTILIPYSSYVLTGQITLLTGQTVRGEGYRTYITKGANIDMFDLSAPLTCLENLELRGDGATYTGRGIILGTAFQNYQRLENVFIYGMNGFCVEFTAADAGCQFRARRCIFQRQTATNPSVGLPTSGETAGNRRFIDCSADGGWLLRFNSGINTWIIGCDFVNLDFSASDGVSLRAVITGCRIATGGSAFAIRGNDTSITNNVIAGPVTVDGPASRNRIAANTLLAGATITDNSTAAGDNVNEIWDSYAAITPVWRGTTTDPVVGNGSVSGRVYRSGRKLKVDVTLSCGSTTTYGVGAWYFTLPAPFAAFVSKTQATGSARVLDSGTQYYAGTVVITAGSGQIYAFATQGFNSASPMTWATGDTLSFSIEFEIS